MITSILEQLQIRFTTEVVLRMLAALALALLLWGWVTTARDPETTRIFSDLSVSAAELSPRLLIVNQLPTASIRLEGPRSEVETLTQADLGLRLDLDGIDEAGEYVVPLEVDRRRGVRDVRITPSEIRISIRDFASRRMPVEVLRPPSDGTRTVGIIAPSVTEVTVDGDSESVARVERVIVRIELGDRLSNFSVGARPVALSREGIEIPEVTISPQIVQVNVEVDSSGKVVPVRVSITGEPAGGYILDDPVATPSEVQITGPEELLATITEVSTQQVDVSGVTAQVSREVGLQLPPGVTTPQLENGQVDVVVPIRQSGIRRTLEGVPITIVGGDGSISGVAAPATVNIVLILPDNSSQVAPTDVLIFVNINGLAPGSYERTPMVSVPPEIRWESITPTLLTVTIFGASQTPPATPVSSPPVAVIDPRPGVVLLRRS